MAPPDDSRRYLPKLPLTPPPPAGAADLGELCAEPGAEPCRCAFAAAATSADDPNEGAATPPDAGALLPGVDARPGREALLAATAGAEAAVGAA